MADKPGDLVQGTLDILILKHRYGIAVRLEQMSQGVFRRNAGSLFVGFQRLHPAGLIRSGWKSRGAKDYVLTDQGREKAQQRNTRMGKASGVDRQNLGGVVSEPGDGVQKALGHTIGLGADQNLGQFQIVGVVKDSRQRRLDEPPARVVYFSFFQVALPPSLKGEMMLEVRTAVEPSGVTDTVRRELLAVEKNLPIYAVKTLTQQVQESLIEPRMIAWLASLFGLLALLLASVGLYGVIQYSTARRTAEIGIRMALGARRREVITLVIREVLRLTVIGAVIGLALAFAAGRAVSSMLYGVGAADPIAILGAILLMFSAAALASFLPARRASKVDPMVALRHE